MSYKKLLLSLVTLMTISTLNAASIADMKKWGAIDLAFKEDIDSVNTECGLNMKGTIDKKSFAKVDSDSYSINGFCGSPVSTVRMVCRGLDDATKKLFAKKITQVSCSFGGKGKRSFKVTGSTINYVVDVEAPEDPDADRAVLEKVEL